MNKALCLDVCLDAISAVSTGESINKQAIQLALAPTTGTTFGSVCSVTPVKTAAAFKDVKINKVSVGSVQLFNNLKEYTDVYINAVKRSAGVDDFVKTDTWFHHTECFPVVEHNTNGKHYLWAIFNRGESMYIKDGTEITKEQVAEYMTPSEAKKLLEPSKTVYNATNDLEHDVTVRTISLDNIAWMNLNHLKLRRV